MCRPRMIARMQNLRPSPTRAFCINRQEIARNTKVSFTRGAMAEPRTYPAKDKLAQDFVDPICPAMSPCVVITDVPKTVSQSSTKNTVMYLFPSKIALTRRVKSKEVDTMASVYIHAIQSSKSWQFEIFAANNAIRLVSSHR